MLVDSLEMKFKRSDLKRPNHLYDCTTRTQPPKNQWRKLAFRGEQHHVAFVDVLSARSTWHAQNVFPHLLFREPPMDMLSRTYYLQGKVRTK